MGATLRVVLDLSVTLSLVIATVNQTLSEASVTSAGMDSTCPISLATPLVVGHVTAILEGPRPYSVT